MIFNQGDERQPSIEMIKLRQQIEAEKAKRSNAVAKLKECAEDVIKDIDSETKIFTPSKAPAIRSTGKVPKQSQVETAQDARSARKKGLADLKKTTSRAVEIIRETRLFNAAELRRALEAHTSNDSVSEDGLLSVVDLDHREV